MRCRSAVGLVGGGAGSQGPDGLWNSKGNPRNRHGEWALEGKARAKPSHPKQQNEAKQKQKLKATSE
jgi:hypothetical protein